MKTECCDHVLKCISGGRKTRYDVNSANRIHSVITPMGSPQPGTIAVSKVFTFDCLNSCTGKISRNNAMSVVFQLIEGYIRFNMYYL